MTNKSKKGSYTTISAQNTFSTHILIEGDFVFDIQDAGTGNTISVQYTPDGLAEIEAATATWYDVTDSSGVAKTFDAAGRYTGNEPARETYYRWGIKTGNYGSAAAVAGLFQ